MPRGVGVRVPLSAQTRLSSTKVSRFFASKGTRQLVAPQMTYLREAVLLRNFCHCLILSLKTSFQTTSDIANNLQLTASARSPLGFCRRSSYIVGSSIICHDVARTRQSSLKVSRFLRLKELGQSVAVW